MHKKVLLIFGLVCSLYAQKEVTVCSFLHFRNFEDETENAMMACGEKRRGTTMQSLYADGWTLKATFNGPEGYGGVEKLPMLVFEREMKK